MIGLMLARTTTAQADSRVLNDIDMTLARLVPDINGTHRPKIVHMLALREQECATAPKSCLSFAKLSSSLCKVGASDGGSAILLWRSILQHVTNREDALRVLNQLKSCSLEPTSGQLLGSLELLERLNTLGWLDLVKEELSWFGIHWKTPTRLTDEDLRLISSYVALLSRSRPLPIDIIGNLSLVSARWAENGNRLRNIEATSLKFWFKVLKVYLANTGQSQALAQAALSKPVENLGKDDLEWSIGITKAICLYWNGVASQRTKCQSALANLKKRAVGQPPLLREIEFQELKMELESEVSEDAKKKAEALALKVQEANIKDLLSWIHFSLSKLSLQLNQLNAAKSHLAMHFQLASTQQEPPFSISGKLMNIDILTAGGQYELARKEAETVRADLMKSVRGTTNSLVWLDVRRLELAAVERKSNDANRIANELKKEIADLPDLKILNTFVVAILRGMTGANALSDIASARKEFGPRSYEIMRIESIFARLAKPGT